MSRSAWGVFSSGMKIEAVSLDRDTARDAANILRDEGRHGEYQRVLLLEPKKAPRVPMVRERNTLFHRKLGTFIQIQISCEDGEPMSWAEVHAAFTEHYPDRWAFEMFPPGDKTVDEINAYHLWVLGEDVDPEPFRIDSR